MTRAEEGRDPTTWFAEEAKDIARTLSLRVQDSGPGWCRFAVGPSGQEFRVIAEDRPAEGVVMVACVSNVRYPYHGLPGQTWQQLEAANRRLLRCMFTRADGANNSWFSVTTTVARHALGPGSFARAIGVTLPHTVSLDQCLLGRGGLLAEEQDPAPPGPKDAGRFAAGLASFEALLAGVSLHDRFTGKLPFTWNVCPAPSAHLDRFLSDRPDAIPERMFLEVLADVGCATDVTGASAQAEEMRHALGSCVVLFARFRRAAESS